MVDAVRLVVDQARRAGGQGARDRARARRRRVRHSPPIRRAAPRNAGAAAADPAALAVIGTYELACSERALARAAAGGAVARLAAQRRAPASRGAPPRADGGRPGRGGGAAREGARRQRASAIVSQRPGAATAFATALVGRGSGRRHRSDRASWTHRARPTPRSWASCERRASRSSRWRGRPARGRRAPAGARARCPRRQRPAVVAPAGLRHARVPRRGGRGRRRRSRDLAVRAGRAARRRARAASRAPTPTSTGSRRRWRSTRPTPPTPCSRRRRAAGGSRAAVAQRRSPTLPAPRRAARPLGCDARTGGVTPRRLAVLAGRRAGRSASSGWSRSRSRCRRPGSVK